MDVLNAFEGSVRIGKDNNMTNVVEPQLHVAPCDPGPGTVHANDATYAMHHDIDPWLEERMRIFTGSCSTAQSRVGSRTWRQRGSQK